MKPTPYTCMICNARFHAYAPFYILALYWHVRREHCEPNNDGSAVKGSS